MNAWLAAALILVLGSSVAFGADSLIDAVRMEDRDAAIEMIKGGADVDAAMSDGTTALHWAAHNADLNLVKRLIKAGADVNARNDYGATPMSEAAILGEADIIKALLKAGGDPESPNLEGQTALMAVARSGHLDAARLLLKNGADVNAREDWKNQTALIWAAAQNQPEMVELLVEYGADVDARSAVNHWKRRVSAESRVQNKPSGGLTALLYAARQGCAGCAEALVEGGANIDMTDPDGITPLLMATLNARWDVAKYLIEAGADIDKWDFWGRSPLYSAVDYNTVPRGGRQDRPSLDEATALQVVELLLDKGANPDLQLKLFPPYRSLGADRGGDMILTIGTTPLLRAAKADDLDAVRLLLKYGANPNLPNMTGYTPLLASAALGSNNIDTRGRFRNEERAIEISKLILAAGGDLNARNNRGQTAAHGAAVHGWSDYLRFLADHGVDLTVADNQGYTPLEVAEGKAYGLGRGGAGAEARPETAAVLKQLIAEQQDAQPQS